MNNRSTVSKKPAIKRVSLTGVQKKDLCLKKKAHPNLTHAALAKLYGIKENTVSTILKNSSYWLNLDESFSLAKRKRERIAAYPVIEEALYTWLELANQVSQVISGHILQKKAKAFATLANIDNFNASDGWLSNFKKRYNLQAYKQRGEAASAPIDDLPQFRVELRRITENYQLEDIYNCDETALYWQLLPSKSIATGPSSGIKKSKQRITILLTVKATGSHKLKLLIINNNKWQTPRSLKHIDKTSLPVYYFWNKNAWMQRSIFEIYLKNFNNMMQQSGRYIILLTDNASCHLLILLIH